MNKRGFSLVELLAAIAILAILSSIAITASYRYQQKAKKQAYDTLVASAKEAAEEYAMEHPSATTVNFDTLVKEGYLENAIDPAAKDKNCTGTVKITEGAKGTLQSIFNAP